LADVQECKTSTSTLSSPKAPDAEAMMASTAAAVARHCFIKFTLFWIGTQFRQAVVLIKCRAENLAEVFSLST
ncbi:hypothetical protein ACC771_21505, partial [Rhizobium ruizarguesonis]